VRPPQSQFREANRSPRSWPIVLDTNVVLDLLLYQDAAVDLLRQSLEDGLCHVVANALTLAELEDVLSRATLGKTAPLREAARLAFLDLARIDDDAAPEVLTALPACRDASDQKFVELAHCARSALLVTRDRALLELARRVATLGSFKIVDPMGASAWLIEHAAGIGAERPRA